MTPVIHITVDLEATIHAKLREINGSINHARAIHRQFGPVAFSASADRQYLAGWQAGLEWILVQAGVKEQKR